jgi:uncharacterized membrane protein YgdD (TMEM256/DUF423 family)
MNSLPSRPRLPLVAAGLSGLTGVGLGALGAHAMAATLTERGMTHAWQTAAHYHMIHALALLGVGIWLRLGAGDASRLLRWTTHLWLAGIVLFSGSLYGLAAGGPRWLGPVTPIGGIAFMAGWILLAVVGWKRTA